MADQSLLRVVSNAELDRRQALEIEREQSFKSLAEGENSPKMLALAAHIRKQFQYFKWHRTQYKLQDRYLKGLRAYSGEYDPEKANMVKQFGGSDVYARLTTVKCRGASALLRDVYLNSKNPWQLEATPVPSLPDDVAASIQQLVETEAVSMLQLGEQPTPSQLQEREDQLLAGAKVAARKEAHKEAKQAQRHLSDVLLEGGFEKAFAEFLIDLPISPTPVSRGRWSKTRSA